MPTELTEAQRETARRMRSVLAKDLLQCERSMLHYDIKAQDGFRRLADSFWYASCKASGQSPDIGYEPAPGNWWQRPEVW